MSLTIWLRLEFNRHHPFIVVDGDDFIAVALFEQTALYEITTVTNAFFNGVDNDATRHASQTITVCGSPNRAIDWSAAKLNSPAVGIERPCRYLDSHLENQPSATTPADPAVLGRVTANNNTNTTGPLCDRYDISPKAASSR